MTALVWFRSDLRVDDNTALHNALLAHQRVEAAFVATPGQWREHDMAPVRGEFLWRNLHCLRDALAALGIALRVLVVPRFDDSIDALSTLAAELQCDTVLANREYGVNEIRRDAQLRQRLEQQGVVWRCFDDATLLPPGTVLTQQSQPFKVFTPFRRALLKRLGGGSMECLPVPRPAERRCEAPALPAYPYESSAVDAALWPAGEAAAAQRLRVFIESSVDRYAEQRDRPALDATSRLSPYLALGVISARRCIDTALAANGGSWEGAGAGCWLNELLWREFYLHLLAQFPQLSMHRPLRPDTEAVRWRRDEREFAAWCEGRTGFPLVDAAMRQLNEIGWMHNRLRMVTAMFLSKYLLLDWRWGERYFMRQLVDGDLAANNGGWQWSASTGSDAAPYFRLLNPLRQMERFDPDARFCKQYLPELRRFDAKLLLQPGHPELLAAGYPAPLVDLREARLRVLEAFSG